MPIVRLYPEGEVSPQPLPNVLPTVPAAGDLALFGGERARDLQVAGQARDSLTRSVAIPIPINLGYGRISSKGYWNPYNK